MRWEIYHSLDLATGRMDRQALQLGQVVQFNITRKVCSILDEEETINSWLSHKQSREWLMDISHVN